jgi:hypothetical protein
MKKLGLIAVLVSTLITSVAVAADRRVIVTNQSDNTVVHLYGSNVNTSSWEEDILGSRILSSGESIRVNFDDGTGHCLFDIKAVFADGRSVKAEAVNVCTESQLFIH